MPSMPMRSEMEALPGVVVEASWLSIFRAVPLVLPHPLRSIDDGKITKDKNLGGMGSFIRWKYDWFHKSGTATARVAFAKKNREPGLPRDLRPGESEN